MKAQIVELDSKNFDIIFNLSKAQPWIGEKIDGIKQLLYKDCKRPDQQQLIIDLLTRFSYINDEEYQQCLNNIIEDILTTPEFDQKNTMIVATASDRNPDSSQFVIYEFKRILSEYNWDSCRLVNRYDRAYTVYKEDNNRRNIILVDEFIGTGQTISTRVKSIRQQFKNAGVENFAIYVKVIAATKEGYSFLEGESLQVTAQRILKKGISDMSPPESRESNLMTMLELEKILSVSYQGQEMPSLGYGQAQALYYRDRGNSPNNVFPIFWWKYYRNGEIRLTILARSMGD